MRYYKDEAGEKDVDLRQLAAWMIKKGHKPPTPKTPVELLARELASALREETRYDKISGRPYRANHAFASGDLFTWFDIDEKPVRRKMHASLMKRREQMVGDGLQFLQIHHDATVAGQANNAALRATLSHRTKVSADGGR